MEYSCKDGTLLEIHLAHPEQAQAVLDYLAQVGGESDNLTFGAEGLDSSREEEAHHIARTNASPTSAIFCGWVGDELVSVATLGAPVRPRTAHTCEIGLSVLAAYQNRGIGTRMLETLLAFAKNTGVLTLMHLLVRADNAPAIALYKKLGFGPVGIHRGYLRVDGVPRDVLIMDREIVKENFFESTTAKGE